MTAGTSRTGGSPSASTSTSKPPRCGRCPMERFDVAVLSSNRVDTKSRVCVRQVHYSVPVRYVRQRLDVRVGAETIEVLDGARVVARHGRGRKGDEVLVLDHYLEVLARKPGAMLSRDPTGPGPRLGSVHHDP